MLTGTETLFDIYLAKSLADWADGPLEPSILIGFPIGFRWMSLQIDDDGNDDSHDDDGDGDEGSDHDDDDDDDDDGDDDRLGMP